MLSIESVALSKDLKKACHSIGTIILINCVTYRSLKCTVAASARVHVVFFYASNALCPISSL